MFIWRDDKTGKFSATTLKSWILFCLLIALCVYLVFIDDEISNGDISVLEIVAMASFGQGALYLGKRVNERRELNFSAPDFGIQETTQTRSKKRFKSE